MKHMKSGLHQIIGERVKSRRETLGFSLKEFANLLGVSSREANKYESGDVRLSAQRMQQVADILDTPIPYFFQGLNKDLYAKPHIKPAHLFKQAAYDYLKSLIDHVADPIFVKDRDHRWIDGNKAFWELMGGPPENFLGKSDYDCFPKAEADIFWEKDDQVFTTGETVINEEFLTDSKGKKRILSTKKTLFYSGSGEAVLVGIIRDITAAKELENLRRQADLFQKEQQYRCIFESSNDAIFIFSTDGRLIEANPGASKIYGYTHEEFLKLTGTDFVAPENYKEFSQFMEQALSGKRYFIESVHLHKDGTPIYVEISGTSFMYNDAVHLLAVVREITERKKVQWEQEEAARRKDQFLAMLSHELRNPLAPISNAMHILQSPVSNGLHEETITLVNQQVNQITRLLDDLLDVSRITLGKIQLRRENLNLSQIIDISIESVKPLMHQKEHTLDVNYPLEPVWVHGDATRLSQVFTNLLNNAAKYTEKGGHISVNVKQDKLGVTIRVKDNGTGISKEMLPYVFDLFAQEDDSMERSYGGLGIGLTLVRKLIEMHKGNVTVHSEGKGKGSEFIVRLPVQVLSAEPTKESSAIGEVKVQPQRVLIVDDNMASAKTLTWAMEALGHQVKTAGGGEEAIAMAKVFLPSVILLDIGLPGMNGFDVCAKLRNIPELHQTLIIAQTGWGQREYVQRSKEAGFNHHLVKPVDMKELEKIINQGKSL